MSITLTINVTSADELRQDVQALAELLSTLPSQAAAPESAPKAAPVAKVAPTEDKPAPTPEPAPTLPAEPEPTAPVQAPAAATSAVDLATVRKRLADLTRAGHKEAVQALIAQYAEGGQRLSDVPEHRLVELFTAAGELAANA